MGITGASSENPAVPVLSDLVRRRAGMLLRLVTGKSDAVDSAIKEGERTSRPQGAYRVAGFDPA
ncbi:hypothetical protein [uncultured Pseudacidovorax sp.]|uniref:hypothetical protein n=1 Tax=uncultured Pseudacidovorax sp. TaxID=679313 RepID=UPI0025E3CC83|nr:hypothetical protein [uncultured Pseudacidovorax sp.]